MAAGSTLEVYFKGYVTGCSIASDDSGGMFTIAMKPGSTDTALLTRTSVSAGNIANVVAAGANTTNIKPHAGQLTYAVEPNMNDCTEP